MLLTLTLLTHSAKPQPASCGDWIDHVDQHGEIYIGQYLAVIDDKITGIVLADYQLDDTGFVQGFAPPGNPVGVWETPQAAQWWLTRIADEQHPNCRTGERE
jgi:hypothetical protein